MIEQSDEITHLIAALHRAQGMLNGAPKDSKNPHFKNHYASLEAVIHAAKPALQAHGLAFTQAPGVITDGYLELTTMLMHVSGEWMRSTLHLPLQKQDPQGVGSAITYGSRYALMAALGLPPVDDDAEAAIAPAPAPAPKRTQPEFLVLPSKAIKKADAAPDPRHDPLANAKIVDALCHAIDLCDSVLDITDWLNDPVNLKAVAGLPEKEKVVVRQAIRLKKADLALQIAANIEGS